MTYDEEFESAFLEDASEEQIIIWLKENKYYKGSERWIMPLLREHYEPLWAKKNHKVRTCVAAYGCDLGTLENLLFNGDDFIKKTVLRNSFYGISIGFLVVRRDRKDSMGGGIIDKWEVFSNAFYNPCIPHAVISDFVKRLHHFSHISERQVLNILQVLFFQGYIESILSEIDNNRENRFFGDEALCIEDILRFIASMDIESILRESIGGGIRSVASEYIPFISKLLEKISGDRGRRFSLRVTDSEIKKFDANNYEESYFKDVSQYLSKDYGLGEIQSFMVAHAVSADRQQNALLSHWYAQEDDGDGLYLMYCFQHFTLDKIFTVTTIGDNKKPYNDVLPDVQLLDWSLIGNSFPETNIAESSSKELGIWHINSLMKRNHRAFASGIVGNKFFYENSYLREWLAEFCKKYDAANGMLHIPGNFLFRGDFSSMYNKQIEAYKNRNPQWFD